jgi:hypothetical protein
VKRAKPVEVRSMEGLGTRWRRDKGNG